MAKNFAELANEVLNPAPAQTAAPTTGTDRVKAKVWLNLGVTLPMQQEDGSMVDTFISIPVGVPLDTMEPMVARGNNVENNQKVEIGNMFMEHLQQWADSDVAEGESVPLTVEVQARRVKAQGTAGTSGAGGTNPLVAELHKHIKLVK